MKRSLLTVVLLSVSTAWAGPHEDAIAAYRRGDYTEVLRISRPLAVKGEAWAQFNLGVLAEYGQGVVRDYAEAVKWHGLAAAQGMAQECQQRKFKGCD